MTGYIYKSDALNVIAKLINENKRLYDTSFHKGKRAALIEALEEIEKIKDADVQPVNRWICGCVFEADDTEYKYQFCQREGTEWWECKCPNCGKLTNKSIPTR